MRRTSFIRVMVGWMALCAAAVALEVTSPQPGQVVQRGDDGSGATRVAVTEAGDAARTVEVAATDAAGRAVGEALRLTVDGGKATGEFQALPAGGPYTLTLTARGSDGAALATQKIEGVLVGDLWVLAGQSNMEGYSRLQNLEPPSESVRVLGLEGEWSQARDPLSHPEQALDPVHWRSNAGQPQVDPKFRQILKDAGIDPTSVTTRKLPLPERVRKLMAEKGVAWGEFMASMKATGEQVQRAEDFRVTGAGLGIAFGKELNERADVPIGLIMAANGGTSLGQWSPERKEFGGESLYGSMLAQIERAGGKVKGILWYQGESDAGTTGTANSYADRFAGFIETVRADVGQADLPFLYVQIARFYGLTTEPINWNRVQQRQLEVEKRLEKVAMVSALEGDMSDAIHISAASLRDLGRQMAKQAMVVAYSDKQLTTGPRFESAASEGTELRLVFSGVNGKLELLAPRPGFIITDGAGRPVAIRKVEVDAARPNELVLTLAGPLPAGSSLAYGVGLNPVSGVVDAEGLALPAFAKVPLGS